MRYGSGGKPKRSKDGGAPLSTAYFASGATCRRGGSGKLSSPHCRGMAPRRYAPHQPNGQLRDGRAAGRQWPDGSGRSVSTPLRRHGAPRWWRVVGTGPSKVDRSAAAPDAMSPRTSCRRSPVGFLRDRRRRTRRFPSTPSVRRRLMTPSWHGLLICVPKALSMLDESARSNRTTAAMALRSLRRQLRCLNALKLTPYASRRDTIFDPRRRDTMGTAVEQSVFATGRGCLVGSHERNRQQPALIALREYRDAQPLAEHGNSGLHP